MLGEVEGDLVAESTWEDRTLRRIGVVPGLHKLIGRSFIEAPGKVLEVRYTSVDTFRRGAYLGRALIPLLLEARSRETRCWWPPWI